MNTDRQRSITDDALTAAAGRPTRGLPSATRLEDLGLDSLGLAELVEDLEQQLRITIADEVTARILTIGDLHAAVQRMAAEQAR